MSDFNSLVQYTVENISRPVKYVIYKLTEFIRVVDKFIFRQVPSGAASGYATIEQIEGNTVVWNQLVQNGNFSDTSNWNISNGSFSSSSNICTIINTGTSCFFYQKLNRISGHVYYICADLWSDISTNNKVSFSSLGGVIGYLQISTTKAHYSALHIAGSSTVNWNIGIIDFMSSSNMLYVQNFNIYDLTAIFGVGNEPSTVAEFEAWLAQNIGTLPYYDYNAGELLSVKMSGMQTEDSSQQTLDTIALDVTTITGINSITNVREVIFPNGMRSAGSVHDTLTASEAVVRIGSRTYQSGDESDSAVITDGTNTLYALSTPITYTDLQDANGNPLNPRYKVEQGGTEQVLPVNTSTPTTVAPTLTTTYTKDVH